jgi:hypothetical protein
MNLDVDTIEYEYQARNPPYSPGRLLRYIPDLITEIRTLRDMLEGIRDTKQIGDDEWMIRMEERMIDEHPDA